MKTWVIRFVGILGIVNLIFFFMGIIVGLGMGTILINGFAGVACVACYATNGWDIF